MGRRSYRKQRRRARRQGQQLVDGKERGDAGGGIVGKEGKVHVCLCVGGRKEEEVWVQCSNGPISTPGRGRRLVPHTVACTHAKDRKAWRGPKPPEAKEGGQGPQACCGLLLLRLACEGLEERNGLRESERDFATSSSIQAFCGVVPPPHAPTSHAHTLTAVPVVVCLVTCTSHAHPSFPLSPQPTATGPLGDCSKLGSSIEALPQPLPHKPASPRPSPTQPASHGQARSPRHPRARSPRPAPALPSLARRHHRPRPLLPRFGLRRGALCGRGQGLGPGQQRAQRLARPHAVPLF